MKMYGMTCPHCGAATGYSPVAFRKLVEIAQGNFSHAYEATGSIFDYKSEFFFGLSRCQACEKAFLIRGKASDIFNPDQTVQKGSLEPLWPTRYRAVAQEIPSPIREAMEDASAALGAGSVIGAMLACRTAVIRALRQQKEELKLPEATLKALVGDSRISRYTFDGADVARRVANYLGHDEPDPEKQYSREDAEELYEFVEVLLDELYVKPAKMKKYQDRLKGQGETKNQSKS